MSSGVIMSRWVVMSSGVMMSGWVVMSSGIIMCGWVVMSSGVMPSRWIDDVKWCVISLAGLKWCDDTRIHLHARTHPPHTHTHTQP